MLGALLATELQADSIFLLLYKELYFRHLYSKLVPTLQQRIDSWNNYVEFFDLLLSAPFPTPRSRSC
jgi:translation initiation factor 3 subunit L